MADPVDYVDNGVGYGVQGRSENRSGVIGRSTNQYGVRGRSTAPNGAGVLGGSDNGPGVYGVSTNGIGIWGVREGGTAGRFDGNLEVSGNITVAGDVFISGADCAEHFDVLEGNDIDSGTVLVIDSEGALQASQHPYDKKVAGVVSGSGNFRPGIVLDRQELSEDRVPVALFGKVECKVDAQYAPVEVGDLLTTSSTPGHAMRADDPSKAFGAVIGKALRPLKSGQQMIPILIALQ